MTPWKTEETSLPGREVSSVLHGVILFPLMGTGIRGWGSSCASARLPPLPSRLGRVGTGEGLKDLPVSGSLSLLGRGRRTLPGGVKEPPCREGRFLQSSTASSSSPDEEREPGWGSPRASARLPPLPSRLGRVGTRSIHGDVLQFTMGPKRGAFTHSALGTLPIPIRNISSHARPEVTFAQLLEGPICAQVTSSRP